MTTDHDPETGQFLKGHAGHPGAGRPRKLTFRQALKQEGSPQLWAAALWRKALDPKDRDSARLLEYIGNWLEGAPRQMLTLEADADSPAVLLMRQIWSRLGGVEDSVSQSAVIDAEVRELSAGQADANEQDSQQSSQSATNVNNLDNDVVRDGGRVAGDGGENC